MRLVGLCAGCVPLDARGCHMADTVRASPSATQPDAVPGTKVLGPTSSNGGNSASGTGGGASNAGGAGKVRLKGLISRVHASVQVKRKYLVQTYVASTGGGVR